MLLAAELDELNDTPVPRATAGPEGDNPLVWRAYVIGEEDSPFDGGIFTLRLEFTTEWPKEDPNVRFLTSMFHPGVNPETGETNLAAMGMIQRDKKRKDRTVRTILEAAVRFVSKSGYLSPSGCVFNEKAAVQIAKDLRGFEETANRWTYAYAR
jgi:ubiquitin-protein ligase